MTIGHPPQREERTLEILIYPRDLTPVTQRFKEPSILHFYLFYFQPASNQLSLFLTTPQIQTEIHQFSYHYKSFERRKLIPEFDPRPLDSCHSRVILNQQNLYPRVPTAVAKLLQYSGCKIEHRDGFSSYK